MGFNTVLVVYNDSVGSGADDPQLGRRICNAVSGWHGKGRDPSICHIYTMSGRHAASYGQVISQAHADYYQVVVVGKNSGRPIQEAENLDWITLDQLADCLKRHGWTAKPPAKRKSAATEIA